MVASDCSSATATATANSKVVFDVTEQVQKAVSGGYGTGCAGFWVGFQRENSRNSHKQFNWNNASTSSLRPSLIVSTGSTSDASSPTSTTSTSSSTFRVLQWNTHHGGYGTDGATIRIALPRGWRR